MKNNGVLFYLEAEEFPTMRLRSITDDDVEELRIWKNKNKDSFFYKKEISPCEQSVWFQNYLQRDEDWILVAETMGMNGEWKKFGCLGYRVMEEMIDLYNIIRGNQTTQKSSMRDMMLLLTSFLNYRYSMKIKCDVLVDNPAVEWYNKCGFFIYEKQEDYYVMMLDKNTEIPLKMKQKESKI